MFTVNNNFKIHFVEISLMLVVMAIQVYSPNDKLTVS